MTRLRTLFARCVPFGLMLLVVFSAGTGTARASLSPALVAAAAPLFEPEAEHKALPAAVHQQRRNQPITERRVLDPAPRALSPVAVRAGAPSRTGHLPRTRAPPFLC